MKPRPKLTRPVLENLLTFAEPFGIDLYPWQREAFGQASQRSERRFRYRLAGISVPRGNGKSYGGAVVGLWRLLCGPPPQDIISVALDTDGARVVLQHAKNLIRANVTLQKAIEVQSGALLVPSTGSRWTIASAEHTASRGRHPTLVLYDEIGWARLRIEVRAANFRSLRGPTVVACILDEVAFFKDETSAQPDVEIYRAVRPAMATVADALLIGISSPFGRSSGRAAHSR